MNNFKIGDKVKFIKEYKIHTGNFYVGKIDNDKTFPIVLVKDVDDIGLDAKELLDKYTTDTRDYDVAEYHQIEKGWDHE